MDITTTVIESIVPFVAGVILGSFIGWYAHSLVKVKGDKDSLKILMASVMLFVWVLSVVIDMFAVGYETPWMVHALLGGVVGSLFEFDFNTMIKKK